MFENRRIAALMALLLLAVAGTTAAGQAAQPRPAAASAEAFAREAGGSRVDYVSASGDGDRSGAQTRARASTSGTRASALAAAAVEGVNVFSGLVTAAEVRVRASSAGDGTSTSGAVLGLAIEGQSVPSPAGRTTYDLNGYGRMVALESGSTGVLGLRITLTKDYKGHEAGSVVRVGYASATARDGVRAAAPKPAAPKSAPAEKPRAAKKKAKRRAKKRELSGRERLERAITERQRQETAALLATPGYAFPVAGKTSYSDDWGAPRATTGTHIGNDIFAGFGTPVLAVADGRLYRVGTRKISGNRLWLRDRRGHRFFYAHLADFAAAAYNGAEVHAGEVIGFVGTTGDAEQTPPHLHFEVHLSDRSPVNPFPLLQKWEQSSTGTARWVKRYGEDPGVRPGALVVVKDFLAEP